MALTNAQGARNLKNTIMAALTVSLLALASSARADAVSASNASMSNIHMSFADVDPTDAVVPSYALFGMYGSTQVYNAEQYHNDVGDVATRTATDADNYGEVTGMPGTVEGAALHSHATAMPTPPADFQTATAIASGMFTLSPGGALTFSADADLSITDATGVGGTQAVAYIQFQVWSDVSSSWFIVEDHLDANIYEGTSASGPLQAYLVNTTDEDMTGYFNSGTQATAQFLSAVAEPGDAALLVAGLGLVGLIGRRRLLRSVAH